MQNCINRKVDYLIIGQGLAGSALALALLKQQQTIIVVDREDKNSASRVAAGLVTTVGGKNMNLAWRQEAYLPKALEYYSLLEKQTGQEFYINQSIVRLFESAKQAAKFKDKQHLLEGWVSELETLPEALKAEHGGFVMERAGRLDTQAYLDCVRKMLGNHYMVDDFDEEELCYGDEGVTWKNISAKKVILCQGVKGLLKGSLSPLGHRSAAGDILTVRIEGLEEERIINRNGWLIPIDKANSIWRAGATYSWDDMEGVVTDSGRLAVEEKIQSLVHCKYTVLEHLVGVRPIVRRSIPFVGLHPDNAQLGFFNGLGSKGVMTAPAVADAFAESLVNNTPLDPELEIVW